MEDLCRRDLVDEGGKHTAVQQWVGVCGRELVKGLTFRLPEVTDSFLFLAPGHPEIHAVNPYSET